MKKLLLAALFLLNTLSVFAQSSYNFTRSDTVSLNAVSKWKDVGGMDVAGSSFGVSSNQGYPYHPTGNTFYGGVYWDSALTAPYRVRIVLKQLSATDNVKNFYLVVSDTNTFNSYGSYHIILQEMAASGGDYMYLREGNQSNTLENGGATYYPDGITAPLQSGNHVANDTFYINVYSDGRKTAVRKRGSTVDSLTTTDASYNVTSGAWVWLYGRVAPTAFLIDDFSITSLGAAAASIDTVPPSIDAFTASNSGPSTTQSFSLSGTVTDNYGVNYVIVDSSQNGSAWAKWDSVKVNAGSPVTSYSYNSPSFSRASADTVYFRMRAVEDSSHVGYVHIDTSATVTVRISAAPVVAQYNKKVFAWLTFQDTRWAGTTNGNVPADSIPWDAITHASLFAANGANPPQSSYIAQYPYLASRAHQSGVDAGICVGGSGDAAVVSMIADSTQWTPWINTYVGYLDASRLDFIDFDLEGTYTMANVRQFFKRLYDTLNVSTRYSGNNPSRKPYIVLTSGVSRAVNYGADTALMNRVEFVNLMTYDYNNNAWGRTTFDNSPKSYTNYDGTGAATDSIGTGVNAVAPSMQRMAMRVAAAGWPKSKLNVGMDFNGGYWTGTTYIRQVPAGTSGGSNATFAGNWTAGDNFNAIPTDSIFFDTIARAYWARWNNKLWTWLSLPGRDSGIIATRKVVDSMALGGVCIWNFGSEVWYTGATVPTGGRGWHMNQIRTYFSGIVDTNVAVLNPPTVFTPADAATNVSTAPTLDWNDVSGASKYHIQFGPVGGALSINDTTLAVSQQSAGSLSTNTQYSYRVRVKNAANAWGPWSNNITFTTVPAVPGTPTLTIPADAATGQAQTLSFFWSAPVSGGTVTNYGFELDNDNGFSPALIVDSSLTGLTRQVAGLANSTTYYWRVRAKSYAGGWGSYTATRTFATSAAIPSVPTLLSPINGASNQSTTPVLSWTRPAGADSFRIQIDTTADFASTRKDTTTANASYTASLTSGLTFYWRVLAKGTAGSSSYSSPFQITIGTDVQPPAPGTPYRSPLTYDPTSGKYSTSPQTGFEMLNVPLSSLPKPYDTNTVMWGVRGYREFDGDTVSYSSGSGVGLTWSQILDSIKATTFDTLKLRSPLIKQDLRFQTGISGQDSATRLTVVPQQVSQNATVTLPVRTGKTAVSDAGERVDFQSISLGDRLSLSYGGTGSNLTGKGGTSQVLMKEGSGDTVTVRQLTTADISGYTAGGSTDTTSLSNRINAKPDSSTVLYWADTTLSNGVATNYDLSLKLNTAALDTSKVVFWQDTTLANGVVTDYDLSLKLNTAALDTSRVLFWADTTLTNGVATNYDLSLKLNTAALDTGTVLYWADTTLAGGIATQYDLTQVTASPTPPTTSYEETEDWVHNAGTGKMGWTTGASGTGSAVPTTITPPAADSNRIGILQFNPGTTAAGYSTVYLNGISAMRFGGGETIFEAAVKTDTGVSAVGDYTMRVGFTDATSNAVPVDGAYFEWASDSGSGGWRGVTANNSTFSRTSASSAVSANTWYRLRIVVNSDGSSASFYINGTLLGSALTSNIPKAAGREFGITLSCLNYGTPVGSRLMKVDYVYIKKTFNPAR